MLDISTGSPQVKWILKFSNEFFLWYQHKVDGIFKVIFNVASYYLYPSNMNRIGIQRIMYDPVIQQN